MNNKNQYEEIIDQMMIDEISALNGGGDEIREFIESGPKEDKRLSILSILDKDQRIYKDIRPLMKDDTMTPSKHITAVVTMLREYVKVGLVEKKKFGEVMTPQELVIEMLDKLPKHVWLNPDLKWLDPCNGVGIFTAIVVSMLMDGLKEWEPDEELRYKHIMEEMIYVCELQPKNMFLFLCAFDPKDKYSLNIYNGSYLDKGFNEHMSEMGVDKFDVIVMNPPYQELKEGNKKSQPLWDKFVIKSVSDLVDGGYLVAVHPSGYRNVTGVFKPVQNLLKSKQILYLEIHNQKDGVKTFGVKTDYDIYCLHNVPCSFNTKIKCQDGTIERVDLSKMEFIPNGMYKEIENLIAKTDEETVLIINNSSYHTQRPHMSKIKSEEFKYPCAYTVMKKGTKFWYSNTNKKGHFGIPKFIWGNGEVDFIGSMIDEKGEVGLTQFTYAIVDDIEKLPYIKKTFDCEEFKIIMNMCVIGKFSINNKVFSLFRKDFWKEFI